MNLEELAFDAIPQSERALCLRMARYGTVERLPMQNRGMALITAHEQEFSNGVKRAVYLLSAWGRKVAQMEAKRVIVAESGF